MRGTIGQIEKHLAAIHALLAEMRDRTIPDIPDASIALCAWPCIVQSRCFVLACLEELLSVKCQRSDPYVSAQRFIDSQRKGVPDYWTRDPISEGVIDTAVELGVLNQAEKALLLKEYPSDHLPPDSDPASLLDELANELRCIQSIVSRCTEGKSIDQPSGEALTSGRSPEVEAPNPNVSDGEVRAALETRFKGSLEREIDGTLGKILIFHLPPNTSPEQIAVKTIDPKRVKVSASLGAAIQRFEHEVRQWIKYRHSPLILRPFFTALVHGWPYVAMPYCECTLRDYIDQKVQGRGRAEAVALMVQVLSALEYASRYGLKAHQDLKPQNVLLQDLRKRFALAEDYPFIWRARLADFGLANAYIELNVRWGSRPYQAPEQYEESTTDLSKVDVFACGVMLHELLTGRHPIGQVTSDVWPEPKSEQSRQWRRENRWKRWARSSTKLCPEPASGLGDFRHIIEDSLRTDPRDRPSLGKLQRELLDVIKRLDNRSYEDLKLLLARSHFWSIYSSALEADEDVDRYQLKHLEKFTH